MPMSPAYGLAQPFGQPVILILNFSSCKLCFNKILSTFLIISSLTLSASDNASPQVGNAGQARNQRSTLDIFF